MSCRGRPTSRGYGASFNGLAALLTMLNSCAAGVGVMNIDNVRGGCLAHRINAFGMKQDRSADVCRRDELLHPSVPRFGQETMSVRGLFAV